MFGDGRFDACGGIRGVPGTPGPLSIQDKREPCKAPFLAFNRGSGDCSVLLLAGSRLQSVHVAETSVAALLQAKRRTRHTMNTWDDTNAPLGLTFLCV
jgi:hypothetical protein